MEKSPGLNAPITADLQGATQESEGRSSAPPAFQLMASPVAPPTAGAEGGAQGGNNTPIQRQEAPPSEAPTTAPATVTPEAPVSEAVAPVAAEPVAAAAPLLAAEVSTTAIKKNDASQFRLDWVRNLQLALIGRRVSTNGNFDDETVQAVAKFQADHAAECGVSNGIINPGTRRALEQTYPGLKTQLLGKHLGFRFWFPADIGSEAKYGYYRSIIENAGGVFLTGANELNLLGIRGIHIADDGAIYQDTSAEEFSRTQADRAYAQLPPEKVEGEEGAAAKAERKQPSALRKQKAQLSLPTHDHMGSKTLNDMIVSIWVDAEGKAQCDERKGSVDPSEANTERDRPGTAHLRDGQYAYQTGQHRTTHHGKALDTLPKEDKAYLNPSKGKGDTRTYDALRPARNQEVWRESRVEAKEEGVEREEGKENQGAENRGGGSESREHVYQS
jgi:hypothetical protein